MLYSYRKAPRNGPMGGMVEPACDLVERRASADDNDPERGTVDAGRFVQWVEYYLCPVLGDSKLEL